MSEQDEWRLQLRSWLNTDEALLFLTAPVGDLAGELQLAGLAPVLINLGSVEDKASLMETLRDGLGLDAWFGANWDALNDALYAPEEPDATERVLVIQRQEDGLRLPENDFATLIQIVNDVAQCERSALRGAVFVG